MISQVGYIYIRRHSSYDIMNACKMGKAINIPDRDTQYATGEVKRGYFHSVFEVPIKIVSIIERLLQYEFINLNIKYDAGTEFYDKDIIPLIEPYLDNIGIKYKKLSEHDIIELTRSIRIKKTINKISIHSLLQTLRINRPSILSPKYTPRSDQLIIIEKTTKHFQTHNKGLLVLMCGVGKTLISLWIAQKLNAKTIVIGVPNKLLLKQWENTILELFQPIPYLIICSGVNITDISHFLEKNKKECIIITTYSSSHKLYSAVVQTNFIFNIKINDECHHLTTDNMKISHTTKKYVQMLNIPCINQLSLTATLKQIESDLDGVVSNDNIEYFGEVIDRKCLLWAINNNIICDYMIQTIITDESKMKDHLNIFNITDETDTRLFLSAFSCLKSIYEGFSHHLLIYSNNKENSLKLIQYISILLSNKYFEIQDIYYSSYNSEMNQKEQINILHRFENTRFGIITCVYCLGEGWDFPLLDGVVFSENMSSNIRIVQSALRAGRKNIKEPDKKTKIILPVLNSDDWLENKDNVDLKKVREVIYQMGLEDESISQKIKVFKININCTQSSQYNPIATKGGEFMGEYIEDLTEQLKLKTVKRTALSITYEKAKKIISEKQLTCKESYYSLCEKDNRLTTEPEIIFKGQFTNWIDYLGIDRKYYDLETCKSKVAEYLVNYPEIKQNYLDLASINKELCNLDKLFPPNGLWAEYYEVQDLRNIISITPKKKKLGVIL